MIGLDTEHHDRIEIHPGLGMSLVLRVQDSEGELALTIVSCDEALQLAVDLSLAVEEKMGRHGAALAAKGLT